MAILADDKLNAHRREVRLCTLLPISFDKTVACAPRAVSLKKAVCSLFAETPIGCVKTRCYRQDAIMSRWAASSGVIVMVARPRSTHNACSLTFVHRDRSR